MRDTHAAIISRDAAAQIDRLLRRNSQLPPRTAGALRSLAGLVSCGECGTRIAISKTTIHKKDKVYLYLRPVDCPQRPKCKAIPYDLALRRIITQICQYLPQAVSSLQNSISIPGETSAGPPSPELFQAQIAQKEAALAQLPSPDRNGSAGSKKRLISVVTTCGAKLQNCSSTLLSCPRLTCRNSPRRWRFLSSGSTCLSQSDGSSFGNLFVTSKSIVRATIGKLSWCLCSKASFRNEDCTPRYLALANTSSSCITISASFSAAPDSPLTERRSCWIATNLSGCSR